MNKLIRQELHDHLTGTIIPFWDELMDNEYGGFYGYMGSSLTLDKQSEKGGILNSRILWMYSNAYMLLNDKTMLFGAQQAFNFLKTALLITSGLGSLCNTGRQITMVQCALT